MAIDYPAGVYDLYMKYLNEIEQEGIASDASNYIPQLPYIFEGDGGPDPDDPFARRLPKEYDTEDFEALALRDEYGNIKYGLSEEEQALMDQIRMKQGLNLRTDYPLLMAGPFSGLGMYYNRRRASKKAEQDLAALVANREQEKVMAQVNANIAQYGTTGGVGSDRPNVGINVAGEGKGVSPTGGDVMGTPFDKGGRVGYADGLSVYPILDVTQSGADLAPGITLDERDITYGGTILGQGDNWYGGIEGLTGNVKIDVEEDGQTLFKDTMGKDDIINYILGYGDPEDDKFQLKLDEKLENAQFMLRKQLKKKPKPIFGKADSGIVGLLN